MHVENDANIFPRTYMYDKMSVTRTTERPGKSSVTRSLPAVNTSALICAYDNDLSVA